MFFTWICWSSVDLSSFQLVYARNETLYKISNNDFSIYNFFFSLSDFPKRTHTPIILQKNPVMPRTVHRNDMRQQDANAQWQCYGFKAGEDQAWCRSVGVDGCTEYKVRLNLSWGWQRQRRRWLAKRCGGPQFFIKVHFWTGLPSPETSSLHPWKEAKVPKGHESSSNPWCSRAFARC